jgi:hypothetical protein
MKHIAIFFCLFVTAILSGCKQTTEPSDTNFYVLFEAESSFQNDHVQAILDNKILLDSTITTNDVLSLAWGSRLQKLSKNDHTFKFILSDFGVQKNYIMKTQYDTTSILIRFDRDSNEISFKQIKGIMYRD